MSCLGVQGLHSWDPWEGGPGGGGVTSMCVWGAMLGKGGRAGDRICEGRMMKTTSEPPFLDNGELSNLPEILGVGFVVC